jgi:hypothetical protein
VSLSATDNSREVCRPTALLAGPIHSTAGFTCPLWSVLRVWLPSRRFAPGPTSPALFQTGCAPGLRPSEVAHTCGGTAFLQLRTDRVVHNSSACSCKHVSTASSATSRFCPARVPVVGTRVLPRAPARASPGLLLSGVCPSIGLACPSACLRPLACSCSGHPEHGKCHSAYLRRPTVSIRRFTGHSQ